MITEQVSTDREQETIFVYPSDLKKEWETRPIEEILKEGITVLRYEPYFKARKAYNVIYVDNDGNSALLKCFLSRPVGTQSSDYGLSRKGE